MITFNNIVERFKIFAENHFFIETFSFGSPDDVDLTKFTSFPLMHLVYTGATYDPGTKTYNLEVYILDVPADKTKKVDRQKEVVSDAEQCAEDIIADIKNGGNIFLFAQDYEVVNATTTPLEEETKNVLSGVLLDLSVSIPYEWDACNAPIDGVEPGGTEVTYARRGILRMLTLDGATDVPSVRTIKVTNGTLTDDGDGVVTLDTGGVDRLSQLEDTAIVTPEDRESLIYDGGQWVNDTLGKGDVGLANVDNTSDADKPVSTATQTALNAKADSSSVPTELNDLSDVTITGTPAGNEALIFDTATSSFKSLPNFTNRFEDEAENNKPATPFAERVYTVKADGDGIFIDAQSDTPSSGKVIERKIYHKAGFLESGDAIGDFTLIHTFADDTAYSATTSTFEGFRDGDTYGSPPFTLIQTWEEATAAPTFTGLLNESYGSGAAAAYSVRRLNGNYTGAAIQVERSSDNTYQDIGFDSNGDLDESALSTFCSGTVCKVRTWYGQEATGGTGSGNDAVQTTHANQPTIYTGGAIVKKNGKPAANFDATDFMPNTYNFGANFSAYAVASSEDLSNITNLVFSEYVSGSSPLLAYVPRTLSSLIVAVGYSGDFAIGTGTPDTNQHLFVYRKNSTTISVRFDGTAAASNTTSATLTSGTFALGGAHNALGGSGSKSIQEVVIYDDGATDDSGIESNLGDYFTQNTPLLDTYSGAAAAYSLRKLRTAYTGDAIRVRRSNDNAEADIGFNVFGELDTVSLAAHCGSNDGFVKTWYCQSGNANDATQTTAANQPKIYDGTTGVVTDNGKPAIEFDDDGFAAITGSKSDLLFHTSSEGILFNVGNLDANSAKLQVIATTNGTSSSKQGFTFAVDDRSSQGSNDYGYYQVSTPGSMLNDNQGATFVGSQYLMAVHYDRASGIFQYKNGSLLDSVTGTYSYGTGNSTNDLEIGNIGGNYNFSLVGKMQELIFYNADDTNRAGIETNLNTFYTIY